MDSPYAVLPIMDLHKDSSREALSLRPLPKATNQAGESIGTFAGDLYDDSLYRRRRSYEGLPL
jgi:hypothetical protein